MVERVVRPYSIWRDCHVAVIVISSASAMAVQKGGPGARKGGNYLLFQGKAIFKVIGATS